LELNLPYLIPRVIRHFLPDNLVRALLLRSIIIRPGLETSNPEAAVQRYAKVLPVSLNGKRVLIFGYGGRFDLGFGILKEARRTSSCAINTHRPMRPIIWRSLRTRVNTLWSKMVRCVRVLPT